MKFILNKLFQRASILLFTILLQSQLVYGANLKLPSILDNHMVLQQENICKIWGWAKFGDSVMVRASWQEKNNYCVANEGGKWKLSIPTPKAGGPYEILIKADTTIILKDVLIGEVWVCSGQSNMQMPLKGYISMPVFGSNDYIAKGYNNNLRLFDLKRKYSIEVADDCSGNWVVSNPADVANFSAVAYSFGKYIQDILEIPIGLILSSWGDTPIEAWTDKTKLKNEFNEIDLSELKTDNVNSKSPSVLFNGMIHPILNYCIRGVIWYQGESNRKSPEKYSKLFPAMINNWRDSWGLGNFPFLFVQIAPYSYRFDKNTQSAFLREAQFKTMQNTPNTGMVVTMDIGDSLSNHPPEKILIGKRLAYWALGRTYNIKGLSFSGPVYNSMIINKEKAIITFKYAELGLTSFGKELKDFVISGEDRIFYPAKAVIKDTIIEVWSEKVKNPVSIRYCWKNYAKGTLYNNAGLPASSFRTDEWEN